MSPSVKSEPRPVVFEFRDYKAYLRAWIEARPQGGRGEKSRMAERARCHLAYISQVLTGHSNFSLEQAEALNGLLEHGEEEANHFILLVEFARAGTHSLRKHFEKRIAQILNQRLQLKNRFTDKKSLTPEKQSEYYSHWAYCAIHMAVLNPRLRTPGAIARYLDLGLQQTIRVLEFLTSVGLVRSESGEFLPGDTRIHLEHDSPMISKHHTNWRIQAVRSLERETPHELHYSGVISVALDDLPKVREAMVRALENVRGLVKESKDEAVYCYNLDLFGLGRE
ncbi:MAG: DUF4423 domain-containing protein [Oligoflexia bacterium]|nr:DUF4423 domain-containing protein [Oligoflexia bacterium]